MQNAGKSRKTLLIGVIAAVVVLAAVLALVLTQCVGGGAGATTTPSTVETSAEVPTYELYWNVDRAEYDGKSEAGMSSRMPESDGYFHVRFILDGEEVVVKVADRKLINAIDVMDLMGLEFDENGIVVGVTGLDDLPLEKIGWQFYVQSAAKTLIKLNSSESMNGMEVLLETDENTGIYDMSGKSGPVGSVCEPINNDRVYAVANLAGEVTHVFIYQRPNYMLTHEAECEHCKKVVTWYEWTKVDAVPLTTGHYQLQNDIQLKSQPAQQEDAKVCLDLNGYRVDGATNSRCYAMFNAGTELAIMDTSEGQTGVMAAHGKGDQGMVVWVRYGAFYLYGGTLDASDATTKLSGTAIECGKGKYFYMYGGTIIGGTAEPQKNDKGAWTQGLGGAMSLGGKFVMNGGVIRDGKAPAKITGTKASPVYNRGYGGNIYASSSAVIELNGGEIKNGFAGNAGGNIFLDGAAELTINGGKVLGGYLTGKGKNGGNIFAGSKTKVTLASGVIANGSSRNCAGNVYTNGDFIMTGGSIYGGIIRDFTTGKVVENSSSANIFNVNGRLHLYGGKIDGFVQCIDTSDTDNKDTSVYLTTNIVIDGGEDCTRNLVLSPDGSGITVRVGKLRDMARIGVYATTGYFTLATLEENKDNFFSDIEGADVLYHDGRLALGRLQCLCGSNSENAEDHLGACKEAGGEKVVFGPWMGTTTMPNKQGNYYLNGTAEVFNMNNTSIVTPGDGKGTDVVVNVDLNGKQIVSKSGRFYSLFENKVSQDENGNYLGNIADEHIELSLSDSVGTAKVTMNARSYSDMGFLVWGRYADSIITIYGGEYDGSALSTTNHDGGVINTSGKLNIHGGTIIGGFSNNGGAIALVSSAGEFNMTGGTIKNGTAKGSGGNVHLKAGVMNMYGGTIEGGSINADSTMIGDLAYGGNMYVGGTFNMYGGTIKDGFVRPGSKGTNANGDPISGGGGLGGNLNIGGTANLYGGVIKDGNADMGGNIGTNGAGATITMDGVQVLDGYAVQNGGNFAINVRGNNGTVIKGETLISGGEAGVNGGNCYVNQWTGSKKGDITVEGGIIRDGFATQKGGNFYLGGSANTSTLTINGGQILDGSTNDCGGNIHTASKSTYVVINGGEVLGGTGKNGAVNPVNNIYAVNSNLEFTGGKIQGFAACNTGANGCTTKISGNPEILPAASGQGAVLSTWVSSGTATFDRPYIEIGTLTEGASVAIGTWGYISTETAEANKGYIYATNSDVDTCYVDGRIFMGKVACICGGTATKGACAEGGHKQVAWVPLESQTISANGNYYLLNDINVANQITLGKEGRPSNVSINLNGHTMTTTFRVFQVWSDIASTLNVADHKGGGAILAKGNVNDNFGGIQMLGKSSTVNFYSGKMGMTEGHNNTAGVALVEGAGTFNMYGGEIAGDGQPSGTLIRVGGTFNMYGGTVKDGYLNTVNGGDKSRGGNFTVSGTLNVYGGTISGGKAQYGGNIAATGTVNISGTAKVENGIGYTGQTTAYPQGGNIYLTGANAKLNMNGGTISGGTLTGSSWMPGGNIYANSKAQLTFDGGAIVKDGSGNDGNNLYLTTDGTAATLKNCTFTNTKTTSGNIMVERGNVTIDGATITATTGYNLRANEGSKVANYTFNSGLISGGNPNVNLGGDDTFVMNGGIIENGTNSYGGNISVTTSKITINGGTIVGGSAKEGGNIALSGASELTINGGEIKDGAATAGTGGNIVVWDTSKVTLNNGTISGGTSTGNGGSIALFATTNVTMNGGTVTGGQSGNQGGNFVAYGKLLVKGGTITNGISKDPGAGMNIAMISSGEGQQRELEITGGTIAGGVYFNNYRDGVVVKLSGNPVIDKELATANKPTYSLKLSSNDLTIGTFTEGAMIMVSGSEGVFSYAAPAGSEKYFTSEIEGLTVWQIDGELTLVHGKEASCVCGVNSDNLADHIGECDGVKHNWLPVNSLPTTSGYYYLTGNVTDSGDQRIVKDTTQTLNIYLDLNGKTVTTTRWRMYRLDSSVNLTITDNSEAKTGTIKISGSSRDQGAGVWFFSGTSTFSMYGGTFDATGVKNSTADAAGMVLAGGGTMKLFAGAVKGGEVTRETNLGGTAVELAGGRVHYFGNVEITGGEGSEISIGDNAKIDLSNVTEAPETPWNVDASGVFTKGWNSSWKIEDYFSSGSKYGAQIYLDEATGELAMGIMDCTCRQATCICDGKEILWQPYRTKNNLPTSTGNYYLVFDVAGFGQRGITSTTTQDVKVDLAGHSVTANKGNRIYLVQNTNVLTITDSVGGGVMYGGGSNNNNCGAFLMQGSTVLNLYAGKLTLSADAYKNMTKGGIMEIGSAFNMYGGEVTGGYAVMGGNIYATGDDICRIMGGKVTDGHGVYEGTETKYGRGGNIHMEGSAVVEISGKAEISGGVASTIINGTANWMPGGNIGVSGGHLTVDGDAVIKGGSAGDGINIYMSNAKAIIDLKKCTVLNTNAGNANIVVEAGTLNVMDGALVKNTATGVRNIATNNSGNNVGIINIKGGTVTGGHTTGGNNGGNIIINGNDILNVSGGIIEDGISENQAGNIVIHGTFTMTGGTIRDGKAKSEGDGHNITVTSPNADSKANITISGGTIAGGLVFNNYYTTPNLKISGAPTIDKSKTSSDAAVKPSYSINMPTSFDIDVTGLTGGKIYIKGTEGDKFAVNATSGMENYFVSETVVEGQTLPVCYQDGGLYFGQIYCTCGYTKAGSTMTAHEDWCDKVDHLWLPWNGSHFMTDGYYYATGAYNPAQTSIGNSDTSSELVEVHVVFDLNGKTLTSGGRSFRVENGSFSVTDTVGGGKVVAGGTGDQSGLLLMSNGVTVNLYRGTYTLTAGKQAGTNGGIMELGTGVTVNLYDVTIKDGVAKTTGGNISVRGGTLNIDGSTITGGKAKYAGNIYLDGNSTAVIKNATISGGIAYSTDTHAQGGNFYVSGKLTIENSTITGGKAETLGASSTGGTRYAYGGNFYVDGSANIVLDKNTVVTKGETYSNGSWAPGGNIILYGTAKLTTNNTTISEGKGSQANNLYLGSGTTATLNAGTKIINTNNVSSIVMQGPTLHINGAELINTAENARNIHMNNEGTKAVLNLNSGSISGGYMKDGNGANVVVAANGTFNMNGGTISGGTADFGGQDVDNGYGGSIQINGTMNMNGGTITGGKAIQGNKGGGLGGNIGFGGSGKLVMTGGTIEKGQAGAGGNIGSNAGSSSIKISGGTIKDGSANKGGNICINVRNIAEVSISGATISGGKATNGHGGNIAVDLWAGSNPATNTMTISNCTISGGTATGKGGNIVLSGYSGGKAMVTITNSTITGGTGTTDSVGGVYINNSYTELTLDGKVDISGNTGKNLYLAGGSTITVNALTSGSKIGISANSDRIISNAVSATEAGYFTCENADRTISMIEEGTDKDKLYFGYYNCICGGTATTGACADGGHAKVIWTAWDGKALSADGNYYLVGENLVNANQITMGKEGRPSNVSVNLNGKTITSNYRFFQMWEVTNSTLNIADHKGGGKIIAKAHKDNFGIAQVAKGSHTINLYSGTYGFADGHSTEASVSLFGIYVSGTVLNVYNATIEGDTDNITGTLIEIGSGATVNLYTGSTVKNGYDDREGGNIRVSGTLNIKGGTVSGGKVTGYGGGSIFVLDNGVVNMSAGTITGGFATAQGGNVRVQGKGTFNLTGGTIKDGISADCGGNIYANGLVKVSGGTITGGKKASSPTATTSVGNNSNVYLVNGDITMTGGTLDGLAACNTVENGCIMKISGNAKITNANGFGLALVSWASAGTTPPAAPVVELGTLNASVAICVEGQLERVFANGTGATMANKAKFTSNNGYKVICTEDGLMMAEADAHVHCVCGGNETGDENHKCYDVLFKAAPATYSGKISEDTNWYLEADLKMNGTTQLYSSDVKICLNGHNINEANNTRGISMHDKTNGDPVLTLTTCTNAGDKTKNKVTHVNKFEAADMGLVIWVRYGTLNLYGVTVDGSQLTAKNQVNATTGAVSAEKNGSTMCVGGNSYLNIYEGTTIIASNTKKVETTVDGEVVSAYAPNGAGIQAGGTSVMYGGTIIGGNSANDAGALYITGKFTMNDGLITGGTAAGNGGNIRVNGTFTMNGGRVENGKAGINGGNITIRSSGKAYINGGVITGGLMNSDKTGNGFGGNIYINGENAELTVTNATIENGGQLKGTNDGDTYGGNIAVDGEGAKVFNLGEGAVITGGKAHRGGNFYIHGITKNFDTYVIDGAVIKDGSTSYVGANIDVYQNIEANKITITMNDGTISLANNSTTTNIVLGAGANDSCYATFIMKNGTVNGGKINLFKNSVFEFVAGTITNYTKTGNGTMIFAD